MGEGLLEVSARAPRKPSLGLHVRQYCSASLYLASLLLFIAGSAGVRCGAALPTTTMLTCSPTREGWGGALPLQFLTDTAAALLQGSTGAVIRSDFLCVASNSLVASCSPSVAFRRRREVLCGAILYCVSTPICSCRFTPRAAVPEPSPLSSPCPQHAPSSLLFLPAHCSCLSRRLNSVSVGASTKHAAPFSTLPSPSAVPHL